MKTPYEVTRDRFNRLLDSYGFEYTCEMYRGGYQWHFPEFPDADIICCDGSYSADEGNVESYGFKWDNGDVTSLPPAMMILYLLGIETEPVSTYTFEDFIDSLHTLLS